MNGNYIKISRSLLDWEWYRNINTKTLFIHMLLKANWKDGKIEGKTVPRGSFVSSFGKLAEETGLTISAVRTAVKHLRLTSEIASAGNSKNTVFTINNYDKYQTLNEQNDKQLANESQTIDKRLATIEEEKEGKIERSNIICPPGGEHDLAPDEPEPVQVDLVKQRKDDFEKIYAIFPKKVGKRKAFEHYCGWLKGRVIDGERIHLTNRKIYIAVRDYVHEKEEDGTELQFFKNFDTFMNKTILDYIPEE